MSGRIGNEAFRQVGKSDKTQYLVTVDEIGHGRLMQFIVSDEQDARVLSGTLGGYYEEWRNESNDGKG